MAVRTMRVAIWALLTAQVCTREDGDVGSRARGSLRQGGGTGDDLVNPFAPLGTNISLQRADFKWRNSFSLMGPS